MRSLLAEASMFTASPLTFGPTGLQNKCVTRNRNRTTSDEGGRERFALNNLSISSCNDSGINECVSHT